LDALRNERTPGSGLAKFVEVYFSPAGPPFVRSPEKDHVDGQRPQVSKLQGEDALKFGLGTVLAQTKTILRTLPAVVQTTGIDALIIDDIQFYAELGAMQLGMPYIHVSNGLHMDFSGYTPICFLRLASRN
jgi:zeaxanthin glucosyltransferase